MPPAADRPRRHSDIEACVDTVLAEIGKTIRLALPLGIGKANRFANALYRRAVADPAIDLEIITALTLDVPRASGELERRLAGPIAERLYGDYVELDYSVALREGRLPANVRVVEFYFQPGLRLSQPKGQQGYISSNYTHVVRDVLDRGVNVVGQLVTDGDDPDGGRLSLSSNPDLTLDLFPHLVERRRKGEAIALVAEVNRNLPYMGRDAEIPAGAFDHLIETPEPDFSLFGIPHEAVTIPDYAAAIHASALVRDGGTLQIGIGAFADALTRALILRHRESDLYRALLDDLGCVPVEEPGQFEKGLYASSEMAVEGFLHLMEAGILSRGVYDHPALQLLENQGALDRAVSGDLLERLVATGLLGPELTLREFRQLQRHGLFRSDITFDGRAFRTASGETVPARLDDAKARAGIAEHCLGQALGGETVLHGGFFAGSDSFYETLRALSDADRRRINMTRISFTNTLSRDETLKRLQRRKAVFINNAMMVTLSGAAVSDGLDDGRVVSGVGGQYNFVTMAHDLPDARSVIVIDATRTKDGERRSNIVWNYGHATIPRHLRDIVVTEYGIADLRGKTDREIVAALLNVADSAFQAGLLGQAKKAGKIEADYEIPAAHRNNTPEALHAVFAKYRDGDRFRPYPFGTELSEEEQRLVSALRGLRGFAAGWRGKFRLAFAILFSAAGAEGFRAELSRMGLDRPRSIRERLLRRLVTVGLKADGN